MTQPLLTLSNYIDGRAQVPVAGLYLSVTEPAVGVDYARCPDSDDRDVQLAVAAAQRAFPDWSVLPAGERAAMLNRVADGIEARIDEFAAAESRDSGKPVALARSLDIPRAIANLRFFAAAITQFASEAHAMGADSRGGGGSLVRCPLMTAVVSPVNGARPASSWYSTTPRE